MKDPSMTNGNFGMESSIQAVLGSGTGAGAGVHANNPTSMHTMIINQ